MLKAISLRVYDISKLKYYFAEKFYSQMSRLSSMIEKKEGWSSVENFK